MIRQRAGLVPAPYFSGGKVQWMLDHVDGLREAADRGDALFGTVDSWVVWNLTGGPNGGQHVTDVTNASRTMLMDLETLQWDDELLGFFGIPRSMLPEIRPSSDPRLYGHTAPRGPWNGEIPIGGALGRPARRDGRARSASPRATPRTPTAPATSCSSTPARSWCAPSTGC